jgi:CheY-like chemotaxis protein
LQTQNKFEPMADLQNPHTTIMLIDDDMDDCKLFEEGLREIDPSVKLITAEGGIEAFLKLDEDSPNVPDFIFLDLNMPMKDGREVLTELKNDELLKKIPIIIYTTSSNPSEKEETLKQGAVSWITKPQSITGISEVIAEILEKYKKI